MPVVAHAPAITDLQSDVHIVHVDCDLKTHKQLIFHPNKYVTHDVMWGMEGQDLGLVISVHFA